MVFSGLSDGFQRLAPENQPYGAWKPAEAPVAKPKPRCGQLVTKIRRSLAGACVTGDEFGGRESIFSIPHTNEFVGACKRALEPTAACCGVNPCRRDYEREEKKDALGSEASGCSGLTGAFGPAPTADASLCGLQPSEI